MAFANAAIWLHIGGGVLVGMACRLGAFGILLSAFARNVTPSSAPRLRHLHGGRLRRYVPVRADQPGADPRLGWSDSWSISSVDDAGAVLRDSARGNAFSAASEAEFKQSIGQALREALRPQELPAARLRFLRLRLPGRLHHCAFPGLYRRYRHRRRLCGDRAGADRLLQHHRLAVCGLHRPALLQSPIFLALIYIARSVRSRFLLLPQTPTSVIIFAIVMGLLWLSTVPPTNALVAIMFGTRHLGLLGGIVFLSHQMGSFLGVWMGGYLYDHFGSYDPVWWLGVALGLFAAVVHWPIGEKSVAGLPWPESIVKRGAAKSGAPFLNSVPKLSKSTHAALPLFFWFNYAQIGRN